MNLVKGATSYEDIRVFDGVQYSKVLLDDDKEYVNPIIEASFRESGQYLCNLLCILLLLCSLTKPEALCDKTWHLSLMISYLDNKDFSKTIVYEYLYHYPY